jgi:hypothetical protein
MKNCLIAMLCVLFSLTMVACQETGDTYLYTDANCCDTNCPCDGDTTVTQTGANVIINGYQSYGKSAWFSIYDMANGYRIMVYQDIITVTEDDIFTSLEEGEYWVEISGLDGSFYGASHFAIHENEVTDVFVDMHEFIMVNVDFAREATSPSGNTTIGNEVPVFDFMVMHDYQPQPLALNNLGFQIHASSGVQIDKAHLYFQTLAGWKEIAIPVTNFCDANGCFNYFDMMMDPWVPIHAGVVNSYRLTLDISSANSGDTLWAEIVTVGTTSPTNNDVRFNIQMWARGNVLTF